MLARLVNLCISTNQEDSLMKLKAKIIALFICSSLSVCVFAKQPETKPGNNKPPSTSEELAKLASLESGDIALNYIKL